MAKKSSRRSSRQSPKRPARGSSRSSGGASGRSGSRAGRKKKTPGSSTKRSSKRAGKTEPKSNAGGSRKRSKKKTQQRHSATKFRSATSTKPKKKPEGPQRLQRLLAAAGYGSRRQCEELIEGGRVAVDGEIVSKLGTTVDPKKQKIHVDDVLLRAQKKVYYAVNKPVGVVTTNADPQGRPRVIDLVPRSERVFPVGRLDRSSEGLILLTNDGDLAQQLAHPKYGVRKVYRVTVAGKVESETMRTIRKGIYIAEGFVKVEGARILKSRPRATELEIVLREGKNREIRRILARMGHKVQTLRRIAIGPLRLGDVPPGAYRLVSKQEVRKLQAAADETQFEFESKTESESTSPSKTSNRSRRQSGPKKKTAGKRSGENANPWKKKKPAKKRKTQTQASGLQFTDLGTPGEKTGLVIGGDLEQPAKQKKKRTTSGGGKKPRKPKKKSGTKRGKRR